MPGCISRARLMQSWLTLVPMTSLQCAASIAVVVPDNLPPQELSETLHAFLEPVSRQLPEKRPALHSP